MEPHDYLGVLRKRWLTVVTICLLALSAAAAATLLAVPEYRATTRLFFSTQGGESIAELAQGSSFTERQMSSYARVATSPLVLDPVIEELDLELTAEQLAQSVIVTVPLNTVILEITVLGPDAVEVARIANLVGSQLAATVGQLSPERPDGSQAVLATTLSPAKVPQAAATPNTKLNLALGLAVGVVLGVGTALLRETLDTRVRSERDLASVTQHPVLGSIVFDPRADEVSLVMRDDPNGQRAESMRRLRTNLQYVDAGHGPKTIAITSSLPNEGKTTTAVNLALALADAGSRVILVDADFRKPSVATFLGIEGAVGLTTVLIGRAELGDALQSWGGKLDVLTAGQVPPNPSELLGSHPMIVLLEHLGQEYDVVLLDTAPLLPVTDAAVLAKIAQGTLVVVDAGRINRAQLALALETLETVDAHVVGVVLNKVAPRETGGYGYGYGYGVARQGEADTEPGVGVVAASGRRAR